MRKTVISRIFVEASDIAVARTAATRITGVIDDLGTSTVRDIKPYWKIQGYFEVLIEILPRISPEEFVLLAASRLGIGWQILPSGVHVWNASPDNRFLDLTVRWADLEVVELPDEPPS